MANSTDHRIMCVAEVAYGTPVAVSRAVPCLAESTHEWDPTPYQGVGLHVSAPGGVDRSDRRGAGLGRGELTEKYEAVSKGLGVALNAAFGTGTSTLVSGTTYQQVFTPTVTNTTLPSRTVQYGIVDNTGTVAPHTYAGVVVDEVEFDLPSGPDSVGTWTFTSDAKALSTATGAGTWTPASGGSLFGLWSSTSSIALGGTLTVPTTTALASTTGTDTSACKGFNFTMRNNIDRERWVPASRNAPTVRKRELEVKFSYEFNATTLRDLQISQGATSMLVSLATAESLSTGYATLQFAVPAMKIDTGALPPMPAGGETVVSDVTAKILWDGTNQPIYVVQRTADSAL